MSDAIFSQTIETLDETELTLSFKDCPNKCKDGKIYNPYTKTSRLCSYCEEKRKNLIRGNKLLKDGNKITDVLNLNLSVTGNSYNFDLVLPEFARDLLVKPSIDILSSEMSALINKSNLGDLPTESKLFNLGSKVFWEYFINPLLLNYYREGRSVAPLSFPTDIIDKRNRFELGIDSADYNVLIDSDICVVLIDAGVSTTGLSAVKGLMQIRGYKSKSTIILTNHWSRNLEFLYHTESLSSYSLARLYSVEYTKRLSDSSSNPLNSMANNHMGNSQEITNKQFDTIFKTVRNNL